MGISVADNFNYLGGKPLDGRIQYATLAAMKSMADATLYEGCEAYCVETDKYYQWKSSNTVDASTGKWRERTGGGGGGSITPSLSVVDIYNGLSNVDITVKSDDEIYNVTKNMGSNRYITFDLPWTGDYTVSFVSPTSQLTITKTLNITTLGGYEYYLYDGTEEAITTGTMFESSHYSSNDGSRAFDGNTSTYWIPAQGSSPCWVGKQNVGTYRFTKATVQALIGTSDQSDWIIQGSNDMTTWEDVSLWVMHTSERNKTATFESNGNADTYTSFRMYANSGLAPSIGSGQPSGIQELVFYGISAS